MLDYLRGFGELTLRGLVSVNAPTILKGMLNEWFTLYQITPEQVISLVTENKSLWSLLPPKYDRRIRNVSAHIGNAEWLTVDWMIDAIKAEHPALASLFLGWRKGKNWLSKQINEIKVELKLKEAEIEQQ